MDIFLQVASWLLNPLMLPIYLLPTAVALLRRHRNGLAIFVLNLFLGWTFLGWVAALVWSATADRRPASQAAPEPRREPWRSPVEYIPEGKRAVFPDPTRMEVASPPRSKFADAEEEARAALRAAKQPGGGAWS